jgi:hypothetical protein
MPEFLAALNKSIPFSKKWGHFGEQRGQYIMTDTLTG